MEVLDDHPKWDHNNTSGHEGIQSKLKSEGISTMRNVILLVITGLSACCLGFTWALAEDKKSSAKKWPELPDRAEPLAATFLGGKGDEWLVGGGIRPDGTIVLAGNVLGPTLELPIPVKVLGRDTEPPSPPKPVPLMENGKAKTDKEGKPLFERPSWRHEGVTGFIVVLTPDLKKLVAAYRLPWTAGAITGAAVGADGAIYLAGRATERIRHLGGIIEEATVLGGVPTAKASCHQAFLAKLSPDASQTLWVRHIQGASDAPQVSVTPEGHIVFRSADWREYDGEGKLRMAVTIPGGPRKTSSVSLHDGSMIVGGEHHSPTGREPWRCPTLKVYQPDGKLRLQLYDWGGPYVGIDSLRLVSDSAVRFVTHDHNGDILLYAWSDGGNSVMTREPYDIHAPVRPRGLGITAAGAGVLSCAYLIRLEATTYQVRDWTLWLAYRDVNKPNSVWIDNLTLSDGGSVLIAGRSAFGLWQTGNKLSGSAAPTGEYIAVLRPDLTGVRYCSVVPGAGVAEVSYDKASWGMISGKIQGQERVLFVGSAVKEVTQAERAVTTPTRNAVQPEYGGGACDGYVVMLDLTRSSQYEPQVKQPWQHESVAISCSFEHAAGLRRYTRSSVPPARQTYTLSPDSPRWVTVDAEIRDRAGRAWPSLLYGKPVRGSLTVDNGRLSGSFTVACTSAPQTEGDQSRKVLASLIADGRSPQLTLSIESLGDVNTAKVPDLEAKTGNVTRVVEYRLGKGMLTINERTIPVSPRVTYTFHKTPGVSKKTARDSKGFADTIALNAWLTLKGSELGLKEDGLIDLRIGLSGYAKPAE